MNQPHQENLSRVRPEVDLIPVLPHRKLQRVVVYVILDGVKFIINTDHHIYLCFYNNKYEHTSHG